MLIISSIISGFSLGSMYGLIALGFHVTYVVSNTVNFSQGSAMMIGAVLGYTFAVTLGWPLPLAVLLSRSCCADCSALLVERTLVRPFAERESNAWLMATVAGGILLDNVVLFTFGKEPRSFPSLLARSRSRFSAPAFIRFNSSSRSWDLALRFCFSSPFTARGSARRCSRSCKIPMPRA